MKKLVFVVTTLLFFALSTQDAGAYLFRKYFYHYGTGFNEIKNYSQSFNNVYFTQDANVYVMAEVYPSSGSTYTFTGIRISGAFLEVTTDNYTSYPLYDEDDVDVVVSPTTKFHWWWQYNSHDISGIQLGEIKINSLYY